AASMDGEVGPIVRAFDMGVSDCMRLPASRVEVEARVRTLIRRKQFADRLRGNMRQSFRLATTDAVTGLFNRHYLTDQLDIMIETANGSGAPLSLIIFDLDRFKAVNDTHGHVTGDMALRRVAEHLAANVRGVDVAARFGGEEFAVILPGIDMEEAHRAAERIRHLIAETDLEASDGAHFGLTISAGIASLIPGETAYDLVQRADLALYAAKEAGRNRCVRADGRREMQMVQNG
ncbi:MAG: diguanylate cyclase, partial [Pseudomonadota bacterium]